MGKTNEQLIVSMSQNPERKYLPPYISIPRGVFAWGYNDSKVVLRRKAEKVLEERIGEKEMLCVVGVIRTLDQMRGRRG